MSARVVAALALCAALAACKRGNTSEPEHTTTVPTTVPTPVAPQPVIPAPNALADAGTPPVAPAPNALADAGTSPVAPAPNALADAGAAPVAPTPAVPRTPRAPRENTANPSAPSNGNELNIPPPVQGLPGVQVQRGSNATTVNVGGIRINVPTQ